jgi:hypothetical protein
MVVWCLDYNRLSQWRKQQFITQGREFLIVLM